MPAPTIAKEFLDDPDPKHLEGMTAEVAAQHALIGLFVIVYRDDQRFARERVIEGKKS